MEVEEVKEVEEVDDSEDLEVTDRFEFVCFLGDGVGAGGIEEDSGEAGEADGETSTEVSVEGDGDVEEAAEGDGETSTEVVVVSDAD